MRRVFIDTNVLLYAAGGEHPLQASCQRIVDGARVGDLELNASADVVQEFLFHRLRRVPRGRAGD